MTTLSIAIGKCWTADEKAEGKDITSEIWIPKGSVTRADLFAYPYDEVKVVNGILTKDGKYNHGETSGTLPFEIFVNYTDKPSSKYPYAGWLLALFNPEELSRQKKEWNIHTGYKYNVPEMVVRPGTLDFFLYYGIPLHEQVFACIAFEDIEKLKARILDCLPAEWNIASWSGIPPLSERGYWDQHVMFEDHGYNQKWDPERGGMIRNCWHIPVHTLEDIATFTMIGTVSEISHRDSGIEWLAKTRYEYIKQKANGRLLVLHNNIY